MSEEEFIKKCGGHSFLTTDDERIQYVLATIRYTLVLRNDSYTRGFIDACKAIEAKYKAIKEESNV